MIEDGILRKYVGGGGHVVIPRGVHTVGERAFFHCMSLISVELPEGVLHIGDSAFCGCILLSRITLPKGLKSIGEEAFSCCSRLGEIALPDSLRRIGASAFYACNALEEVALPPRVTRIPDGIFEDCEKLRRVTLSGRVRRIERLAFSGCRCLSELSIPDTVYYLGASAFESCTSLTHVTLPHGISGFGVRVFEGCTSLSASEYEGGQYLGSVESPYLYLLRGSTERIHPSTKFIASSAFAACRELRRIVLPESVRSIGAYAFFECAALEEIVLPEALEEVGRQTFFGCVSLAYTEFRGGYYLGSASNPYLYLERGTTGDVCSATELIGSGAFEGCKELSRIEIPASVRWIGDRAFKECRALSEIRIPEGVKKIDTCTFEGCDALTEIHLPQSVRYVHPFAFSYRNSLCRVFVGGQVRRFGFLLKMMRLRTLFAPRFRYVPAAWRAHAVIGLAERYLTGEVDTETLSEYLPYLRGEWKRLVETVGESVPLYVLLTDWERIPAGQVDRLLETVESAEIRAILLSYRQRASVGGRLAELARRREEQIERLLSDGDSLDGGKG